MATAKDLTISVDMDAVLCHDAMKASCQQICAVCDGAGAGMPRQGYFKAPDTHVFRSHDLMILCVFTQTVNLHVTVKRHMFPVTAPIE